MSDHQPVTARVVQRVAEARTRIEEAEDVLELCDNRLAPVASAWYGEHNGRQLVNPSRNPLCCTAGAFTFERVWSPGPEYLPTPTLDGYGASGTYLRFSTNCTWHGEHAGGIDVPVEFVEERLDA